MGEVRRSLDVGSLVLALGLAVALASWTSALLRETDPTARDQVHDMSLALRVREGHGLSDGNRHPLLPALLAPVAARDFGYWERACHVAAALAGLSLGAVFLATRLRFGVALAVASAVAVVLELRHQARRVAPEPLLAGLLVVAAAVAAGASSRRRPWTGYATAGAVLGLAWLAKGSALLSAAATAIAVLPGRAGGPRSGRLLALAGGFVVAASPLLAWNVAQGHGPLHDVNSAHVMWEDRWDEDLDRTSTATLATWLATHDLRDAGARLAHGLAHQRGVEWVYAALALISLGRLLRRRGAPVDAEPAGEAAWRRVAVATALVWLPAMAWYEPIVASRRLLFPIFPVLVPPALFALRSLLVRGAPRPRSAGDRELPVPWAVGLAALAVSAVEFHGVVVTPPWHRRASLHLGPVTDALRRLPDGSRVLARPSRTIPPDWLVEGRVDYVGLPAAVPDAGVPAFTAAHADYVLVNEGLLRHRRAAFAQLARWEDDALDLEAAADWAELEGSWGSQADPTGSRPRFALFRVRH